MDFSTDERVKNTLAILEERISIFSTVSSFLFSSFLLSLLSSFPLSIVFLTHIFLFSFFIFPLFFFILFLIVRSQRGKEELIQLKKKLENASSFLAKISKVQEGVKASSEEVPALVKGVKVFLPPLVAKESLGKTMISQEKALHDLLDEPLPSFPSIPKLLKPFFRLATWRVARQFNKKAKRQLLAAVDLRT